ncbi:MAG TPA: FG-GAP-like repeat-containing protein [Pirellulales bacterium]|nr:FG-GAP-like repeat-containing protein [Pirellulales bacterium]
MNRSRKSKRRAWPAGRRKLGRLDQRLFHACGEPLERRILLAGYGDGPMRFEPNVGQTDPQALYIARGSDYSLFLTSNQAVLSLPSTTAPTATAADAATSATTASAATTATPAPTTPPAAIGAVLTMTLVGATPGASVTGQDVLTSKSNYLNGNDQSKWLTDVPNYGQVAYHDVYPGVDLTYYGNNQQLEYDFTVAPGGDPSAIKLSFSGADKITIDGQGNLVLHTAVGDVVEHAPVVYQGDGGQRQALSGNYVIGDDGTVSFTVGAYDHARPLVIDPVLVYATYLGQPGTFVGAFGFAGGFASANAVAADNRGNAYVTGAIGTNSFPLTTKDQFNGNGFTGEYDVFVTKLDQSGNIVFSTYWGGQPAHNDFAETQGNGIAVHDDGKGNVSIYVTGSTTYGSFLFSAENVPAQVTNWIGYSPLVNAFQSAPPLSELPRADTPLAFVAELLPSGSGFAYSSYVYDTYYFNAYHPDAVIPAQGNGIAVDPAGNAYVVGTSGFNGGGHQAFVARIAPGGSLDWKDYVGSAGTFGNAIALDTTDDVFFAGTTLDTQLGNYTFVEESLGGNDAYVSKLSAKDGSQLAAARLGGNHDDFGEGVAVDGAGNVYLAGTTFSTNFPTTPGALETTKPGDGVQNFGSAAGFVAKLAGDFSKLVYSTYLGGGTGVIQTTHDGHTYPFDFGDFAHAIAVDAAGDAFIVGSSATTDFPVVDAIQAQHSPEPPDEGYGFPGPFDAFVAELDPSGSALLYSTYLGGTGNDVAYGVALDRLGNAYVVGTTDSTDFPTTANAVQSGFNRPAGQFDGYTSINNADSYFYPSGANVLDLSQQVTSAFVARLSGPLRVTALPVNASLGVPFFGPVASFVAPDPKANFSGTRINWGDGDSNDQNVSIVQPGGPDTPFVVMGSHTYAKLGSYPVVVTVHDADVTTNVDVSQMGGNQSETTIAVDPNNSERLFLASNHDAPPTATNPGIGIFAAYSTDGGKTWSPTDPRDHLIGDGDDPLIRSGGDPKAVFDQFGNLFLVYINARVNAVVLVVSSDGGKTFSPLATFPDAGGVDQPSVAVGPGIGGVGGSVWVTFESNTPTDHINVTGAAVSGPVSGAGGIGSIGAFLPVATAPGPAGSAGPVLGNFGGIDVGPNGQVLVSYMDAASGPGPSEVFVNLDPSGLAGGFNPAIVVPAPSTPAGSHTTATNVGADLPINAQDDSVVAGVRLGIDALPRLAWDRSPKSAHQGRVYLVYTDSPAVGSQNTNIVLRYSDDNGTTWSNPVKVNDDGGGASHFWPSVAVDPSTGSVGVSWYDTRNDPGVAPGGDTDGELPNDDAQLFGAVSGDGGNTFSANVQISIGSSDDDNVLQNPANSRDIDFGDYEGAAFANGFFYPAWADNSRALGANPDLPNYDAAVARIAVAQVLADTPKVTVTPPTTSEGQTFQGTIAKFTDPDPNLSATDFTVTIDWADGSKPDSVTPTGDATNGYVVRATHTYAEEGGYPVQVTVHDNVHDVSGSTTNALDISKLPGNQAEGTIAINPHDPKQLFAASNEEGLGLFAAYSTDGGDSWTSRPMADGSDGLTEACCDPIAAFDQYGNLFLTYLDITNKLIVVAISSDGGQSFTQLTTFSDASGVDKPSLATGPGQGGKDASVWVAYQNNSPTHAITVVGAAVSGAVRALGAGAIGPFGTPQAMVDAGANLAYLAIGATGDVVLIYQSPTGSVGPSAVYASFNASGAPGAFGAPTKVTDTNVGGQLAIPAQADRKVHAGANVAIDTSDAGHKGRIYVVYTGSDAVGSAVTNIFVRYSDDQAKTWSDPVKVNDDTSTSSKFFPGIAVDESTGNVGVSWYDTRNDPSNVKAQFFAAVSTQGGKSFSTNIQVSPGSSNATDLGLDSAGQRNQYNDYTGLAFAQNILYPLWADNSPQLQGNPDQPQFEQAVSKINVAYVSDRPLTAQANDIAGDVKAEGEDFTAALATFTDADPNAQPGVYKATIDWGDKTDPATGTITGGGGGFTVTGEHAYEEEGSYTVSVTINDVGGASAKVTLDAQIEDGKLTASNNTIAPAEGLPFYGTVATFSDSDPNGEPKDYQTNIDWGDGSSSTVGQVAFDGTGALVWTPDRGLLGIGNVSTGPDAGTPYLLSIDYRTNNPPPPTPLLKLTPDFRGGVAEGANFKLYALSNNDSGESFLNLLDPDKQTVSQLAYLGSNFTGGLAYDWQDGNLYAVAVSGGSSTLFSIDPKTWAVKQVGSLGSFSVTGFTYLASNFFFAVATDAKGASTLYQVQMGATVKATSLLKIGTGFTGGLGFQLYPPAVSGGFINLLAVSGDGSGSAVLNLVSSGGGKPEPLFEIGAQYNNGLDVIGAHTYLDEAAMAISVRVLDAGGSQVTASGNAQIQDEPPVPLPPSATLTAFQGFATGPLTLASFQVPHGVETGTSEYTATVNWGDGGKPDAAAVAISNAHLVVSSSGHVYSKAGNKQPVVTLSDDTGDAATMTDTVDVLPDVTKKVKVVGLGGKVNPKSGVVSSSGSVLNLGGVTLKGPFYLIVKGLPGGVTLANADGVLPSGEAYHLLQVSQLSPGQSADVTLQFSDPSLAKFSYKVTVIDGPFGAATPVGATPALGGAGAGFVANVGQTDSQARFVSQGAGYSLFLTSTEAVLTLDPPKSTPTGNTDGGPALASSLVPPYAASGSYAPSVVQLALVGANASAEPIGLDPLSGKTNYLVGNDPSKWETGATSYARVEYRDVYPGITLDYHSSATARLEYDFTVAPGADPNLIRLSIQGAESVSVDTAGNLVLHTAAGDVTEQSPVLYQEVNGVRLAVAGGYVIEADGSVGFRVGAYDASQPLVIDPVLVFSTYLGGSHYDQGNSIAVDGAGNVYLTGQTASLDFPTLGGFGPPPDLLAGSYVAFVTKYDSSGALVYSTYFGGSGTFDIAGSVVGDFGSAIAVDAAGEAVIAGQTYSADFPLVNPLPALFDTPTVFLAKLKADGSGFVFSTYLADALSAAGVALDSTGNIYVAGYDFSPHYHTTAGALSATPSGGFLEKLSPAGDSVLYATYVPGTEYVAYGEGVTPGAWVNALAVDAAGNAYLTGNVFNAKYSDPSASPPNEPVLHAAQATFGGGQFDAFVAKIDTSGSALDYWTYLGGSGNDVGNGIAVDAAGSAYVVGTTMSTSFPTANALQSSFGGIGLDANGLQESGLVAGDAFVTKLSPDGSSFVYSTYLGGSGPDVGSGIAVDAAGNAYVTGQAGSADFPTLHAVQPVFGGDTRTQGNYYDSLGRGDAFLARINASGGALDYSTFLGGSGTDWGKAVAVTPGGGAYVTGFTTSSDFPTFDAAQPQSDIPAYYSSQQTTAFVARIDAQGAGVIHLTNVPFQPTESAAFSGVVASFTDSDTGAAADYSATIDWGDGTTSVGTITSNSVRGFSFNVSGGHTYSEDGRFPVTVTVHDTDGSVASASGSSLSLRERAGVRAADYQVTIDTSSLAGTAGFVDLQFNPGALPDAQAADVVISQFAGGAGTLGNATLTGAASGSLANTVQLANTSILNELTQALTYGGTLSFDVTLEGDALKLPLDGLFGSMFSLTLLGADGVTPVDTTAADGTALKIGVSPDGTTSLVADSAAGNALVHLAAVNTIDVADAPLQATLVPIQAVEGIAFGGTVATFADANGTAPASDFAASVLWGDGTAASAGTVVADGGGRFHVTASHTFAEAGNDALHVVISDKGGSQAVAASASQPTAQITGLQAPRSAYEGAWSVMASGDLRRDGKLDLVVGRLYQTTPGSFQSELLVLLGNGDGSFASPTTITIPASDPQPVDSIAIADFNGDGKPDIAASGMIFLGNGDGTFQAGVAFDTGAQPIVSQAVADLNGDGKLDLVVAGGGGAQVFIGNGDGTFASGVTYGAETQQITSQVFLGNFHSGGKPDIVLATTSVATWLLPNLGDGTFGTAVQVASGLSVAAVGDLNGDGKLDLVAFDGSPAAPGTRLATLMGNGDGTFQSPLAYDAGVAFGATTLGDFYGHGKLDIAVADGGTPAGSDVFGSGVTVLRNKGDGTFAAPVSFAVPSGAGGLVAGDFNGDGNLDLAMSSNSNGYGSVSILLGRGDGTFVNGKVTATGSVVTGLATADFNGDGHSDVAVTGGVVGVEVLAGNGDGTYQSAKVFAASDASQTGPALLSADFNGDGKPDLVTGTSLFAGNGDGSYQPATTWNSVGARAAATGDFTADGKPDLVSSAYDFSTNTTSLAVWLNDGHGLFTTSWSYTVNGTGGAPVVADLNGDGKLDLLVPASAAVLQGQAYVSQVLVFLGNGDGTFQTPLSYTVASSGLEGATVGDFKGNGKPDIAVAAIGGVYVLLGNGDGTFQPAVSVFTASVVDSVSAGDFNQDGKADLLVTTEPSTSEVVTVLLSNGDGTFRTGQTIDTGFQGTGGALVADFNGDGKLDFALSPRAVHLYLGNGDGTFQTGPVYATATISGSSLITMAAADVTGDGRTDLLTRSTDFNVSGATFGVLLGQADGTLRAGRVYSLPHGGVTAGPPLAVDLRGSGKPDLVAVQGAPDFSEYALVLVNDGDGTFQTNQYDFRTDAEKQQGFRSVVNGFTVGDFTGDGIPDIVADVSDSSFTFSPQRVLLVGNGDGTFQAPRSTPLVNIYNTTVTVLRAADINGDGKRDLVTYSEDPIQRQPFVQVELGDGKGGFGPPIVTGPLANVDLFNHPIAFTLGDFNGDGKLDVAVGTTDGSVEVLLGNGDGTFQAPITSALGMPSSQYVAGDLYGDGKTDLVAVDGAGAVAVLRPNGDGTFQPPLRYSTASTFVQYGNSNNFVSLADVNGDGVRDLVIGAANGIAAIINQPSLAASQNVADAALSAAGESVTAVAGATFVGTVAHFTDANPQGTASDFTANIAWGDGQDSAGTIVADAGGGFDVLGSHVYASAGTLNLAVSIADKDGSAASAASTMTVSATPDAALAASGETVAATANVAFSGVVATFTDSDAAGTASDFTALVDWGDGHKSLGLVQAGTGGSFQVVGINTYAQAATYQVAVSIFDAGGATAMAASSADVIANNSSPLTAAGVTLQAVEQAAISGAIATFTDSSPDHQAADYTAIIVWGDGQTSSGAISADASVPGQFDVAAAHSYAEEGSFSMTVQVARAGAAATADSAANVSDAPLDVSGVQVSATEAAAFTGVVASFSDGNPFGTLDEYAATIDWGDGQTSAGAIAAGPGNFNRYLVTGTNTYATAGEYLVTVTITDNGGATEQARVVANVADASLTATGTTLSAAMAAPFSGVVASFADQNAASTAADFVATILWGDGNGSDGSIAPAAGGGYEVSGTHTYLNAGTLPVTVSILDTGGGNAAAAGSAVVAGATVQATATAIQATEAIAFGGAVATFTLSTPGFGAGDFQAAIDWGNGQTTAGTVVFDASTNQFSVMGSTTYTEEGSYPVKIAIGVAGGAVATLSSTATASDGPLTATATATAVPLAALEAVAFSGEVAYFNDANPTAQTSDFTAQIVWGDGQTTAGTVSIDPTVAGQFDVSGSVTYQASGSLPIAVTITDKGGATAAVTATAAVEVMPTSTGTTLQAQADVAFSAAVAVISDVNPQDQPSDYTATIDWGDGHSTAGLVTYDATDKTHFDVLGNGDYTNAGTYSVTVSLVRNDGLQLNVTDVAQVSTAPDASLTALPTIPIDATQNAAVNAVVGVFTDADSTAASSDYTATIDWGDGSTSSGSVVGLGTQTSAFGVVGQHTYANSGTDFVAVIVNDTGGATAKLGNESRIAAAETISGAGLPIAGVESSPLTNVALATFTVANGSPEPSAMAATIDWGDGSTSAGSVSLSAGIYTVSASHTYSEEGTKSVTVALADTSGATATATGTATISDPAVVATGGFSYSAVEGSTAAAQTLVTLTDLGGAEPLSNYSATIDWGDGGSATSGSLSVDPETHVLTVSGQHAYAEEGNYAVHVTLHHEATPDVTVSDTAAVSDPALARTGGFTYSATEGSTAGAQTVATFTDPGGAEAPANYAATIDWGDGSSATPGSLSVDPETHVLTVSGQHPYAEEGNYAVHVTLHHEATPDVTVSDTAAVSDPALVGTGGFTYLATQASAAATQTLAVFTDPGGPEALADYSATIDWGDGTTTTDTALSLDASSSTFSLTGQHAYSNDGTFAIQVTLHHDAAPDATVTDTAIIASATTSGGVGIDATAAAVTGNERSEPSGVTVATFTVGDGSLPAADFTAAINWGDGATSAGTVAISSGDAGGTPTPQYTVTGSHEYLDEGHYRVQVSIEQTAGPATSGATTATVSATATIREELLAEGTVGTADQNYIQEIYRDLFGRLAEPGGRDFWVGFLREGQSRSQVAYDIVKLAFPEEFQRDTVEALYQQYLGRAPDAAGIQFWTAYLYGGGTIEGMAQALVGSQEYFQTQGGGSNAGFLRALFHDALGRPIDAGSLAYFEGLMDRGLTASDAAAVVFSSEEYRRIRVDALFEQFMDRPAGAAVAAYFAGEIDRGESDELVIAQLISSDEYYDRAQS